MIYMRGQARDYDQWAALTGDDAWRWDNALPYFKLHEDHYKGADALHGARGTAPELMQDKTHPYQKILRHRNAGGEWRVEKQRLRWDILDAFAEAASQAGIPATPDFNRGNNEGVGYFEVNQKSGWRWNTAKAFLRPTCLGRPNFELWTNAQVSQAADRAAAGRQPALHRRRSLDRPGKGHGAGHARLGQMGEVILCAGSIGSPHILQLSGIGPAALLQQHGIAVVQDLPGVGANLQDHLQIRSVYKIAQAPGQQALGPVAQHHGRFALGQGAHRAGIRAAPHRPDEHGAVAAGRLHAQSRPTSRIPISSTTSSRCRSTPLASRCTASMPSPPACAT